MARAKEQEEAEEDKMTRVEQGERGGGGGSITIGAFYGGYKCKIL